MSEKSVYMSVEDAIEEIRQGKMIIVTDNEDRENEGDVVMAAEKVTPQAVNFMATHAKGLLCQSITPQRAAELELPMMVQKNTSVHTTGFTVSVDALEGTTTGISAYDRDVTIKVMINPLSRPEDLCRPGHIFPLVAKPGGVLVRDGHTEASVDLPRLAGLYPSGILCEVLDDDGTMARLPRLERMAEEHGLRILTIEKLKEWRKIHDNEIPDSAPQTPPPKRLAESRLPTAAGKFKIISYENPYNPEQPHLALVSQKPYDAGNALFRIHSECMTGEVFGSLRCDCAGQLSQALSRINAEGGVLVYLRQEGRGIGLTEKIRAYALQDDDGLDTVDANIKLGHQSDERDYAIAGAILKDLKVSGVKLMTNNPDKSDALMQAGISINEVLRIEINPGDESRDYLLTKKKRLGHKLELV